MARIFNRIASVGDKYARVMSQSPIREACAEFFGTFLLVVSKQLNRDLLFAC